MRKSRRRSSSTDKVAGSVTAVLKNQRVFISHSTRNKHEAQRVCSKLEDSDISCWIAPRNISPGKDWADAIFEGLSTCNLMVLIVSGDSMQSEQVKKEIHSALRRKMEIIPLRIENVEPTGGFGHLLEGVQYLDAYQELSEIHLQQLVKRVAEIISQAASNSERMPNAAVRNPLAQKKQNPGPVTMSLYYVTNRNYIGADRGSPREYAATFNRDGVESLSFGRIKVTLEQMEINRFLAEKLGALGIGDGEQLAQYITRHVKNGHIEAREEFFSTPSPKPSNIISGSAAMFNELFSDSTKNYDVLFYVHGFNVSWHEAVSTALALQLIMNSLRVTNIQREVAVVLFTWPSDCLALPFVSYRASDTEATVSGFALGRLVLNMRDFFIHMRDRERLVLRGFDENGLNILCHGMGCVLLVSALKRIGEFTPGTTLPRLFDNIFLCASDLDSNVLEEDRALGRLHELAQLVSVYHNRGDAAVVVSDYSRGLPSRLGTVGSARPRQLAYNVHQIDCSPIVHGICEHSYYLSGNVANDIRQSMDGILPGDRIRRRVSIGDTNNRWAMRWE